MLVSLKSYSFESSDGGLHIAHGREFFTTESQAVFTWPCAILLAAYVSLTDVCKGRSVIEIGAGCGIPSIVAALSGARKCLLTERATEAKNLQNLQTNISKNGLDDTCRVMPLDWKSVDMTLLEDIDVILGADVLYSSEDFECIVSVIDQVMARNANAVFLTTYQERSNRRNISPYLDKYQMVASLVPLESFLHCSHTSDGKCTVVSSKAALSADGNHVSSTSKKRRHGGESVSTDDGAELKAVDVPTFDCMSLLKITRKIQ